VLTLTATPIPRTLHLSLSGLRDLSIIATPPIDRLAIRTYVSEFDPTTIRQALLREHYRGGQSFIVVPRIKDIPALEEFIVEHVPELSHVTVHGKISGALLDTHMNAFYDRKYDILLATTIIESGLDIPTANTIIIHNANMFGLAQLYQIRGRVGRSKQRAYAYLTTKPRKKLTTNAYKRLKVIGALTDLGAGFNLASQDLDLRGAGNILGDAQSGHIKEVGYELYQSLLEEAVIKMKSGDVGLELDYDQEWTPQLNLGVSILIPDDYVNDVSVRLELYKRLSSLSTKVELEGFASELIDRFGKLPKEINSLLNVMQIKSICKKIGISKIDLGISGANFELRHNHKLSPNKLINYINSEDNRIKVKGTKLIFKRNWVTNKDKMKGIFSILKNLHKAYTKK
jgi:transcription-repair coupling factor (superfamily II helicase)